MTDNRTTKRLMAMLEERGVEYKTHGIIGGKAVTWHGSVCNWVALPDERGLAVAVYKDYLTPEQAIAATMGSEREKRLEKLVNQLWYLVNHRSGYGYAAALEAIEELGIEVNE